MKSLDLDSQILGNSVYQSSLQETLLNQLQNIEAFVGFQQMSLAVQSLDESGIQQKQQNQFKWEIEEDEDVLRAKQYQKDAQKQKLLKSENSDSGEYYSIKQINNEINKLAQFTNNLKINIKETEFSAENKVICVYKFQFYELIQILAIIFNSFQQVQSFLIDKFNTNEINFDLNINTNDNQVKVKVRQKIPFEIEIDKFQVFKKNLEKTISIINSLISKNKGHIQLNLEQKQQKNKEQSGLSIHEMKFQKMKIEITLNLKDVIYLQLKQNGNESSFIQINNPDNSQLGDKYIFTDQKSFQKDNSINNTKNIINQQDLNKSNIANEIIIEEQFENILKSQNQEIESEIQKQQEHQDSPSQQEQKQQESEESLNSSNSPDDQISLIEKNINQINNKSISQFNHFHFTDIKNDNILNQTANFDVSGVSESTHFFGDGNQKNMTLEQQLLKNNYFQNAISFKSISQLNLHDQNEKS